MAHNYEAATLTDYGYRPRNRDIDPPAGPSTACRRCAWRRRRRLRCRLRVPRQGLRRAARAPVRWDPAAGSTPRHPRRRTPHTHRRLGRRKSGGKWSSGRRRPAVAPTIRRTHQGSTSSSAAPWTRTIGTSLTVRGRRSCGPPWSTAISSTSPAPLCLPHRHQRRRRRQIQSELSVYTQTPQEHYQ